MPRNRWERGAMNARDPELAEPVQVSLHDEAERIEAQILAARVPSSWIDAASGEAPVDVALADAPDVDKELVRELLTPLERAAQDALIERTVSSFLEITPAVANRETARTNRTLSARRWFVLPVTSALSAAAAVALTLLASTPRSIDGETRPYSDVRGDATDSGPVYALRYRDPLYLECRLSGARKIEVHRVLAVPIGGTEQAQGRRSLEFQRVQSTTEGANVQITSALTPGIYDVSCQVAEEGSDYLSTLRPHRVEVR